MAVPAAILDHLDPGTEVSDLETMSPGLAEMDDDLVYVEGQGWLHPEDAEGLPSITKAQFLSEAW